jgi:hypothetical protein
MFYTPKHCCECGEKIEPGGRRMFKSRRFCEICETDFIASDWAPRVIIGLGILFGLWGIGSFLKKSDKPVNIATTPQVSVASNRNQSVPKPPVSERANVISLAQNQTTSSDAVASRTETETGALSQKAPAAKQNLSDESQNSAPETVYFCGAQTKKGTPCSRRVKGGGRCWQHTGQPAMLPAVKLAASR